MYKVVFEFTNEDTGWAWKKDYLDNNGKGFTVIDAQMIAQDFNNRDNTRNAHIVKMEG